jgi:hypothetical protein
LSPCGTKSDGLAAQVKPRGVLAGPWLALQRKTR